MGNIYIEVDTNFRITKIHRMPFDINNGMGYTREELEKKGFFVKEIPNPINKVGKRAIAMYNPDNKSVYYEYVSIPLSEKDRLNVMENALNSIIKNGTFGNDPFSVVALDLEESLEDTAEKEKDIANYMAYQIISGKLTFDDCMKKCPMYEKQIKNILTENGIQV